MFFWQTKVSFSGGSICQYDTGIHLFQLFNRYASILTDPDIPKEVTSLLVVEDLRVILLDLFHVRMIRCDPGSHQSIGVRVAIEDVDSDFRHILENLLGAVEAGWATSNNSKTVIFVRLHHVLGFDTLFELRVVVLGYHEGKPTIGC